MQEPALHDNTERALLEAHTGEMRDISLGTFRFIAVLSCAVLVLMIAGWL